MSSKKPKKWEENLKNDIYPFFNELYKQGARRIQIDNKKIYGIKISTKKRRVKTYYRTHNLNLKKYGIILKDNEIITMGESRCYIIK